MNTTKETEMGAFEYGNADRALLDGIRVIHEVAELGRDQRIARLRAVAIAARDDINAQSDGVYYALVALLPGDLDDRWRKPADDLRRAQRVKGY